MKEITKKKTLIYALASGLTGLVFGLLSGLVFDYLLGYVFLWTILGIVVGSCITRVVFHICYKDFSAEMWQVAIYHIIAGVGLVGIIYADTWGWVSFFAALVVAMALMAFGSRFIKYYGGTLILYKIDNELRYYPQNNDPKADEDPSRPLVMYAGEALTLAEAKARGLNDEATAARTELIKIYGITLKEEKEK